MAGTSKVSERAATAGVSRASEGGGRTASGSGLRDGILAALRWVPARVTLAVIVDLARRLLLGRVEGSTTMPNIIEIRSLDYDEADTEAKRLTRIIAQEGAAVLVFTTPADIEFVRSCVAERLPAFLINGVVVWEGAHPPRALVRQWLSWPRTVADAVERVLQIVADVPAKPDECEALTETISLQFGLQTGNLELLEACGFDAQSPNAVAEIIISQARQEQSRRRRGLN